MGQSQKGARSNLIEALAVTAAPQAYRVIVTPVHGLDGVQKIDGGINRHS